MNGYKHILAQLSIPETAQGVLDASLMCARKFNGHIDAVHVRQNAVFVPPIPVVSSDMAGMVLPDIVSAQESVLEHNSKEAERLFRRFVIDNDITIKTVPELDGAVSADFKQLQGNPEEVMVRLSRVSDLTVMPRPHDADFPNDDSFSVLNAVLMETGAAVLLPSVSGHETIGTKIAVEWNGSPEAAKAVTLGMPFLRKAEKIVIFETAKLTEYDDAAALKKLLAWNGVDAEIVSLESSGAALCEKLDGGFDLLVMGAYTQSSMRRWILGSTTVYVIEHADVPLLLAH